jgi:hypothetical protein
VEVWAKGSKYSVAVSSMREMKQIVLDQNLFPKGTDIDSLNVFTKNGAKILREIDFTHRAKSDSTFIVALPGEESGEKLNIFFGLFSLTCFFFVLFSLKRTWTSDPEIPACRNVLSILRKDWKGCCSQPKHRHFPSKRPSEVGTHNCFATLEQMQENQIA